MDEMTKSTLEAMIKIYKERGTNTDFVSFQERLQDMKEEVERLKKGNPQYTSMIDEIIREIEGRQTTTYVGYLNFVYLSEISKISEKERKKGSLGVLENGTKLMPKLLSFIKT